eukprot:scaffold661471_cov63-Attheya_sp.AAC.2
MKKGGNNRTKNILLLTDDQNAISEAVSQHPDYNWIYFNRPRYRGTEGGWENQIPSDDPKHEVLRILHTLQLVRQCKLLIYSWNNFAHYIRKDMGYYHHNQSLNLDDDNPFNLNNTNTVKLSKSEWKV